MTTDGELIKRLAREAGFEVLETGNATVLVSDPGGDCARRFASLIAEECAKVVEGLPWQYGDGGGYEYASPSECAEAIRAKFRSTP